MLAWPDREQGFTSEEGQAARDEADSEVLYPGKKQIVQRKFWEKETKR